MMCHMSSCRPRALPRRASPLPRRRRRTKSVFLNRQQQQCANRDARHTSHHGRIRRIAGFPVRARAIALWVVKRARERNGCALCWWCFCCFGSLLFSHFFNDKNMAVDNGEIIFRVHSKFRTTMVNCTFEKNAHAVPLASAREHPENQKENQASHSPERAVEGPLECGIALGSGFTVTAQSQPGSCLRAGWPDTNRTEPG